MEVGGRDSNRADQVEDTEPSLGFPACNRRETRIEPPRKCTGVFDPMSLSLATGTAAFAIANSPETIPRGPIRSCLGWTGL